MRSRMTSAALFIERRLDAWLESESRLLSVVKLLLLATMAATLFVGLLLGVIWMFAGQESAEAKCLASGRGWAISGSHIAYNAAIKSYQRVTDYSCYDVVRR